uniref:Uncharacterized protein n=1 Tax=Anguilla anguilla TaxID=7936 RepID=A0A0E9U764_ANGAN
MGLECYHEQLISGAVKLVKH